MIWILNICYTYPKLLFSTINNKKKGIETRCVYDNNTDYRLYPHIQHRTSTNDVNDDEQFVDINNNQHNASTNILPANLSDITQLDACPLIRDMPSDYQIEAYIACLIKNTICFMPKDSSKIYI